MSITSRSGTIATCVHAAITERQQSLVVDGEQGRCYQAMLTVGALAEAPEFPGATAEVLFSPLGAVGFPSTRRSRALAGEPPGAAQVRKRIADVEHAYTEQLQGAAHGPSVLAGVDRVLAREYEATLQAGGHPPMLYAQIGLALGAPSEEELERRVAALKSSTATSPLHRPVGLQHELLLEHVPRLDGWAVMRDYTQQLTVEQFGAMVPTATRPSAPSAARTSATRRPATRCRSASTPHRPRGRTARPRRF